MWKCSKQLCALSDAVEYSAVVSLAVNCRPDDVVHCCQVEVDFVAVVCLPSVDCELLAIDAVVGSFVASAAGELELVDELVRELDNFEQELVVVVDGAEEVEAVGGIEPERVDVVDIALEVARDIVAVVEVVDDIVVDREESHWDGVDSVAVKREN